MSAQRMKRAVDLVRGDVIVGPDGVEHKVIDWESFPHIGIFYETDTGHSITIPRDQAMSDRSYSVKATA